ncbi:carbapenem self-resistance protein CarG family protein [Enterobacter ludwigii]|uniref:carbapenem self-resistance protein CarG family protein n=1 Tax=Enterobacter ludwigii TaxID=299767 RepID=UPI003976C9C1|nr:CpmJ protein [Klebsiella sp. T2.Ur]
MKLSIPLIILFTVLGSRPAMSQTDTRIHLKQGVNSIDLNGDGIPDAVFSAIYDNNTSHPGATLSIFIRQKNAWYIVPVPDDDGFTWTDLKLSASVLKIAGVELYHKKGRVYLIRAVKYTGRTGRGDLTDKSPVKFSRFLLADNNDDPGTAVFYWEAAGVYITKDTFDNVDEAFKRLDMEKF